MGICQAGIKRTKAVAGQKVQTRVVLCKDSLFCPLAFSLSRPSFSIPTYKILKKGCEETCVAGGCDTSVLKN